jgi:hypothetical protein
VVSKHYDPTSNTVRILTARGRTLPATSYEAGDGGHRCLPALQSGPFTFAGRVDVSKLAWPIRRSGLFHGSEAGRTSSGGFVTMSGGPQWAVKLWDM